MTMKQKNSGYTLIELMVTVAIIGVLATIAIPAYNGYVSAGKEATARTNARLLATFEDNYYYENDTFLAGEYIPGGTDTLTAALGWKPEGDEDQFKYKVEKCDTGTIAQCYKITVTYVNDATISEVIQRDPA